MRKSVATLHRKYKKLKISKLKKTVIILVDFLGILILWRGAWGLFDIFIFPGNQLYSYIVSIVIGIILIAIDGDGLSDLEGGR